MGPPGSTKKPKQYTTLRDMQRQANAVCKIQYKKSAKCGTGFFCSLWGSIGIMTNYHVIKSSLDCNNAYAIFRYGENKPCEVKFEPSKHFWTNERLDATFVAINEKDLDEQAIIPLFLNEYVEVDKFDPIHIYQHPK